MSDRRPYRVLLTGASRGIGRALALALAEKTERIFLIGRDVQALNNVISLISGPDIVMLTGDLADENFHSDIEQTVAEAGGINLLINNAGISNFSEFEHQNKDTIAQLLTVNLLTPILLSQRLLPILRQENDAQIINIGSTFSYLAFPGFAAYSATKFGLRGFTEALGRELADTSVRVRLFSPRATKTEINSPAVTWMNRQLGTVEDDASVVAQEFLEFLSQRGTEHRVGFPEKLFAKINQVSPGWVSRSLRKQLPVIRQAFSKNPSNS